MSGFVPFVLSVPDLNSSQTPLRPFGLRLTVRPASRSLLCHSFVLLRPLRLTRSTSISLSLSQDRYSMTLIHEKRRTRIDRAAIGVKLLYEGQGGRENGAK